MHVSSVAAAHSNTNVHTHALTHSHTHTHIGRRAQDSQAVQPPADWRAVRGPHHHRDGRFRRGQPQPFPDRCVFRVGVFAVLSGREQLEDQRRGRSCLCRFHNLVLTGVVFSCSVRCVVCARLAAMRKTLRMHCLPVSFFCVCSVAWVLVRFSSTTARGCLTWP